MPDEQQKLLHYYAALGENTFYQFTGGCVHPSSAGYPYSVQALSRPPIRRHPCAQRRGRNQQFIPTSIGGLPQTADFLLQAFAQDAWADMKADRRQYCIITPKRAIKIGKPARKDKMKCRTK